MELVVHLTTKERIRQVEQGTDTTVVPDNDGRWRGLIEYGADWARHFPTDIVMLVLDSGICKHCDEPIEEDPGWVRHKWKHVKRGSYLCWSNEHTQAEPKEPDANP